MQGRYVEANLTRSHTTDELSAVFEDEYADFDPGAERPTPSGSTG